MYSFYFRFFISFNALATISVLLHYLGASPWGGALVRMPSRFLPEALLIQALLWSCISLAFMLLERGVTRVLKPGARTLSSKLIRSCVLCVALVLSIFYLIDREVVRWLGQHMSLSYILNFAGARDAQLFSRILSSDILFSSIALVQIVACFAVFAWLLRTQQRFGRSLGLRVTLLFTSGLIIAAAVVFTFRPSEKRWRRVRPAALGIAIELLRDRLGAAEPTSAQQALNDLYQLAHSGKLQLKGQELLAVQNESLKYPLLHVKAPNTENTDTVPQDIILIVFETMRGQNTGFLDSSTESFGAMPLLKKKLEQESAYFPRMHSAGYPSVEGAMGMHLGIWPHPQKIIFSSFLHGSTLGFPEIFNARGYDSLALLGADPSFSNFTPWFRRWYQYVEYDENRHHDGPLIERFIELHRERVTSKKPLLMTLWTATTHPPYDVPKSSGVKIARTNEERYLQAMHYADKQISRLVDYLQSSPRAARTKIIILGDHSQPTPWQWQEVDKIGELNPGHTWTSLAILGQGLGTLQGEHRHAVSHIDLAPTLLDLANINEHHHFLGHSLLKGSIERPIIAFRNGMMSVEEQATRAVFHYIDGPVVAYSFDPTSPASYGALEQENLRPAQVELDIERYRDLAKVWASVIEEDRLFPTLSSIEHSRRKQPVPEH